MLSESIKKLVQYGVERGITPECERIYTTNLLLDVFGESEYTEPETEYAKIDLEEVLNELLDEAVKRGIIEDSVVYRDLFDTNFYVIPFLCQSCSLLQRHCVYYSTKDPQSQISMLCVRQGASPEYGNRRNGIPVKKSQAMLRYVFTHCFSSL